jgi:hypothetical protein
VWCQDRMKSIAARIALVLMAIAVSSAGCNPTGWPGLRQMAKQQDDRETRETEQAIKNSPELQELHQLCTLEIPHPDDFAMMDKSHGRYEKVFIGYGYRSGMKYPQVKQFYLSYFVQHEWALTGDKDGGWGSTYIEFTKGSHRVRVYQLSGREGINYTMICEKLRNLPEKQ